MTPPPRRSPLFPYTTLFRSLADYAARLGDRADDLASEDPLAPPARALQVLRAVPSPAGFEPLSDSRLLRLARSEEHTSELQSLRHLVCRLLLEKKKKKKKTK